MAARNLWLFLVLASSAAATPFVYDFPNSGRLEFVLRDRMDHPLYWWPPTLLNYRVRFESGKVRPGTLQLSENGKPLPMQMSDVQLSNGYLKSALVGVIAGLPSAGERHFVLTAGTPANLPAAITESRDGESIVLDTGAVRVRIPASLKAAASGPLQQFWRDGRWMGNSRLIVPGKQVRNFDCIREDAGPLFTAYRLTWTFDASTVYVAHVRAIAGYDFISLREEMRGMDAAAGACIELTWDGFEPTHRQAPNHPYQKANDAPGYARYNWEQIDQGAVGTQHGVSSGLSTEGELPFRLGSYQPWGAYVTLTSANFWDQRRNDAVGIFIDRIDRWQDHEYAIWNSSNTLQVRYYYRDGKLMWKWPLATGTRSTGVAVYDHAKDIAAMEQLDKLASTRSLYRANLSPMSHTMFLQNRYGTIDLDLVKDWILEYPKSARHPPSIFPEGSIKTAAELEQRVFTSELIRDLPTQGTRQNAGFAPVPSRKIYEWFIDGFNRLYTAFSDRQRERLTAAYLMLAYTHGEEDYMPMKTMLSGHPNFLSDVKSAPGLFAFLFPEHPMTAEWADEFEKFLELNTRYHTRPAVAAWDAKGGRWTENLGTYVWAFLRPALRSNYVLSHYVDGRNRLALPQISQMGDWLVGALSAPFDGEDIESKYGPNGKLDSHDWGLITKLVTKEKGPRRLHPPQGAHSARRMPPRSMWLLGTLLRNFDPLTAEHIMWASRPGDQDAESPEVDPWRIMYQQPDNRGTNPHLESASYTGYGLTLRAAVDSPQEISIHLQQIDEGPNYRWGVAGEGGCGVIYFYAAGKSYSHNAREDVGDRQTHDTDFCSNTGVWKNGAFRSIGRNVLSRPLQNLGAAQYAEITPRQGPNAYSWPEYQGRGILLAGSDYFSVYDHVFNDAVSRRFSWFTDAHDDMPTIKFVKGAARDADTNLTQVTTAATKGIWQDGMGDSMAIVTHRKDLRIEPAPYGARVTSDQWADQVFQSATPIHTKEFDGKTGLLRENNSGTVVLAIFDGTHIAGHAVSLEPSPGLAIAGSFQRASEITGHYASAGPAHLTLHSAPSSFYVDGAKTLATNVAGSWQIDLPAGKHTWQWTNELPIPIPPQIQRSVDSKTESLVYFSESAGARSYRLQTSRDNGTTWQDSVIASTSPAHLTNLVPGKLHVRLLAANSSKTSAPSSEYPIYMTGAPPPHPDGLKLTLGEGEADVRWGEVLGVNEYRLYRGLAGSPVTQLIYHGLGRSFRDHAQGIVPAFSEPGLAADAARPRSQNSMYEYTVSASNPIGEGPRSSPTDTNPASWRNWDPKPNEPFRRHQTYNTTNYQGVGQEGDISRYYPK